MLCFDTFSKFFQSVIYQDLVKQRWPSFFAISSSTCLRASIRQTDMMRWIVFGNTSAFLRNRLLKSLQSSIRTGPLFSNLGALRYRFVFFRQLHVIIPLSFLLCQNMSTNKSSAPSQYSIRRHYRILVLKSGFSRCMTQSLRRSIIFLSLLSTGMSPLDLKGRYVSSFLAVKIEFILMQFKVLSILSAGRAFSFKTSFHSKKHSEVSVVYSTGSYL